MFKITKLPSVQLGYWYKLSHNGSHVKSFETAQDAIDYLHLNNITVVEWEIVDCLSDREMMRIKWGVKV